MIDEAHERTLSTEILLSLLKDLSLQRKDLKIVIASATINAKILKLLQQGPYFEYTGKTVPCEDTLHKATRSQLLAGSNDHNISNSFNTTITGRYFSIFDGTGRNRKLETQIQDAIVKIGDQLEDKNYRYVSFMPTYQVNIKVKFLSQHPSIRERSYWQQILLKHPLLLREYLLSLILDMSSRMSSTI